MSWQSQYKYHYTPAEPVSGLPSQPRGIKELSETYSDIKTDG